LIVMLGVVLAPGASGQVCDGALFPGQILATGNAPRSVTLGDLDGDGDGDLDMAVANRLSNDTSVLLNQCDPFFGCTAADLAEPFGALDTEDIAAFLSAFSAQVHTADLAAPAGLYDLADIVAFVTSFTAGRP